METVITKKDLESLNISKDLQEEFFAHIEQQQQAIQVISQMANNLRVLIERYMKEVLNNNGKKLSIKYVNLDTEQDQNRFKEIMLIGALFTFRLRSFLLNEEIIFSLGAISPDGTQLAEAQISQETMLKSIRSSLSQKAMLLNQSLEQFDASNILNTNISQMWQCVLNLASVEDFDNSSALSKKYMNIGVSKRKKYFYQKPTPDTNVYLRYIGGRNRRKLSYYLKGDALNFYNSGWLYEWFMSYIITQEHIQILENSLTHGSILPIMSSMDAVPGYKGGDYVGKNSEGQLQQIQAKYYNQQIITFKSIRTVILEICEILKILQSAEILNATIVAEKLTSFFTTEETAVTLNRNLDDIANVLLAPLTI